MPQDFISLPLDADGEPILPAGAVLEQIYVIDTIAGTGEEGFAGDGGPALRAKFLTPQSLAIDSDGNLYVADRNNGRVRRIDADGNISTVAGNGTSRPTAPSGDGGPAVEARLASPVSIALDRLGNLFVAEFAADRVRKIDTSGIISTIAGTGVQGSGGDGGPALEAQLDQPNAIAVDADRNVYVAEYGGKRIRKIDSAGTISTLAGNGVEGFGGDGGPATEAQLDFVGAIAVDATGNVYFTDLNTARVRKVDPSGTITTVAGGGIQESRGDGGPATAAQIGTPSGLALDADGNLFVTEFWDGWIRKVDAQGFISTIAGTGEQYSAGDGGPAVDAALDRPAGLAVDPAGRVYVAESYGHRIRVLRPSGQQAQIRLWLGTSGDRVVLAVSENGVLSLDGEPLFNPDEVWALNGKKYSITQAEDGTVLAIYLPEQQTVALSDGKAVSLWLGEDDQWRIGSDVVRNGHRHVESGEEYLLERAGSQWRLAEYTIRTVAGGVAVADGVAATASTLFNPDGLAVDSSGSVYGG